MKKLLLVAFMFALPVCFVGCSGGSDTGPRQGAAMTTDSKGEKPRNSMMGEQPPEAP